MPQVYEQQGTEREAVGSDQQTQTGLDWDGQKRQHELRRACMYSWMCMGLVEVARCIQCNQGEREREGGVRGGSTKAGRRAGQANKSSSHFSGGDGAGVKSLNPRTDGRIERAGARRDGFWTWGGW